MQLIAIPLLAMLCAVPTLSAADTAEIFVLRDGREITGTYDPINGIIYAQIGSMKAEIRVEAHDIVKRRSAPATAPAPLPPPAPAPAPVQPPATRPASGASLDEVLAEAARRKEAARLAAEQAKRDEEAERQRQAAAAAAEAARQQAAREWTGATEPQAPQQPPPPTVEELRRRTAERLAAQKTTEESGLRLDVETQMVMLGLTDERSLRVLADIATYAGLAADRSTADLAPAAWSSIISKHGLASVLVGDVPGVVAQLSNDGVEPSGKVQPGLFSARPQVLRRTQVGLGLTSVAAERAIAQGLVFLRRHQSPNGMWDAEKYFQNCTGDPKAEPGAYEGHSAEEVNVAMTSLSLMSYLGAGFDHQRKGPFSGAVGNGIKYLLSVQKPDGLFGARNYEHAMATAAIAEALAMTGDRSLRGPLDKAVAIILERQNTRENSKEKAGWDYVKPSRRTDFSVTCWNVMALRSASAAGLRTQSAVASAVSTASLAATQLKQIGKPADFPYCWSGTIDTVGQNLGRQALGIYLLSTGAGPGGKIAMTVTQPFAPVSNLYLTHWTLLGLRSIGGTLWTEYSTATRDALVSSQVVESSCLLGSWSSDSQKFHGSRIGRLFSTNLAILCLESGYRYTPGTSSR
jgi:hypothetical protein